MKWRNIIVVSDTHCGCQMGLCPPDGVPLDGGGHYRPSAFQRGVWDWWQEFIYTWIPHVTEGEEFVVVFNGDAVDGRHHNSTTQFSQNLATQLRCAEACLAPLVERAAAYYHIRGTEAHVGPSGESEEELAKALGAIPNAEGQYARYEMWAEIADGARLVHILHHIGTTGATAYEATAVQRELIDAFSEAARWGDRRPDAVVRSHRHRYIKTEIPTDTDRAFAVTTPGWQGKTGYVFRLAGARQSQPQFGGLMVRVSQEAELYERHYVKRLTRPEAE